MINQLGWDTLEQRRLLSQLTMFYKIPQGLIGVPLPPELLPLDRASRLPSCTLCRHSLQIFFLSPMSMVV